MFDTIRAAVISWPRLWATPPAKLTPTIEKTLALLTSTITKRLNIPPAREYNIPKAPVNKNPTINILIRLIKKANLKFSLYKAITITRLAIPSFTPGIPIENGIIASI